MMDWKECRDRMFVKAVSVDVHMIDSLKMSAEKKLETVGRLEIDGTTASTVVTLYYDSLRELLEALGILKGYKIYNHDCYCAFLKEVLAKSEMGNSFDRLRKIRNGINYYGKDVLPDHALELVEEMMRLISDVNDILGVKHD